MCQVHEKFCSRVHMETAVCTVCDVIGEVPSKFDFVYNGEPLDLGQTVVDA